MPPRSAQDGPAAPRSDPGARKRPGAAEDRPRGPLTRRQLEILGQVARGHTNREVGEALGISERTARNHMRTILRKLSSTDRTHAVVLAIGNGWMPIPIEPEEPRVPTTRSGQRSRSGS